MSNGTKSDDDVSIQTMLTQTYSDDDHTPTPPHPTTPFQFFFQFFFSNFFFKIFFFNFFFTTKLQIITLRIVTIRASLSPATLLAKKSQKFSQTNQDPGAFFAPNVFKIIFSPCQFMKQSQKKKFKSIRGDLPCAPWSPYFELFWGIFKGILGVKLALTVLETPSFLQGGKVNFEVLNDS